MKILKDVEHRDNYLIGYTGRLEGKPVWLNLAKAENGKMIWLSLSDRVGLPYFLENKFNRIIDFLEKESL